MKLNIWLWMICCFTFASVGLAQSKEAQKIEEAQVHECEGIKVRSFNLIERINNEPDSIGYIIIYVGKYESEEFNSNGSKTIKRSLPRSGELKYLTQSLKGMLKFLRAPLDKIKIINGGYRQNYLTEFWFVPKGAQRPEPKPTLKTMKFRKGKPPQFTYWDC